MPCTKETVKASGLNIWSDDTAGGSALVVDIIAVQGLGSKPYWTWVKKVPSTDTDKFRRFRDRAQFWKGKKPLDKGEEDATIEVMWIRDLLVPKFKNARIATYSYKSDWRDRDVKANLRECANLFLNELLHHRQQEQERQRPIVLIGHSLGCVVIQQALVSTASSRHFRNLGLSVAGIIFLGAPLQGSNAALWGMWLAQALRYDRSLLELLQKDSQPLFDIARDFSDCHIDWDSVCFYETQDAKYGPFTIQTVSQQSATQLGKRMIPLDTDHSGLNKFSGEDDKNFRLVLPEIQRMVEGGGSIVTERHRGNDNSHTPPGNTDARKVASFMREGIVGITSTLENMNETLGALQQSLDMRTSQAVTIGRDDLMKWLNPVFTDDDFEKALSSRLDGTCNWIQQRSQFQAWVVPNVDSDIPKTLWLYGPPGFGKTVLGASIVEHLQKRTAVPVCFFFCVSENESKRKPLAIVRSWTAQLIKQSDEAFQLAQNVYQGKEARSATQADVWQLFRSICLGLQSCIFVVDGFDECMKMNEGARFYDDDGRVRFLENLFTSLEKTRSRLLFISRDNADIRLQLTAYRDVTYHAVTEFEIVRKDTTNDIHAVSNSMVNLELPNKPQQLREELANNVASKSDGMFLWIKLIRGRLTRGKSPNQLRKMVAETPAGLEHAYEREMDNLLAMNHDDRTRAVAILRWTFFALRPLTIGEMTEALIIQQSENDQFPSDDMPELLDNDYINDQILGLCGSLIILHGGDSDQSVAKKTVHFVHFSVKEYLTKSQAIDFVHTNQAHGKLAADCLQYLCYDDLGSSERHTKDTLQSKLGHYHFLKYAARSWYLHALQATDRSPDVEKRTEILFNPKISKWILWSEIFETEDRTFESYLETCRNSYPNQLYYASLLGLNRTVDFLLNHEVDVDNTGGQYGCSLQAASFGGHIQIVTNLLRHAANPNTEGGKYGFAIVAAAAHKIGSVSRTIVETLLQKDAMVSSADEAGMSAIHYAASNGSISTLEFLLSNGASLCAVTLQGETALYHAVRNGQKDAVGFLLNNGADVLVTDNGGFTALHLVAVSGYTDIAELLLRAGADTSASSIDLYRPLMEHVKEMQESVARELVGGAEDVDMEMAREDAWQLLKVAAMEYEAINPDSASNSFWKFHMSEGPRISIDNELGLARGWTPLSLAASNGQKDVVELLLDQGADTSLATADGITPLNAAANGGHQGIVQLLLNRGADISASNASGWAPLNTAAFCGSVDVVQYLLDSGAEISTTNNRRQTPLFSAAIAGHKDVVQLLLGRGSDTSQSTSDGITPLAAAAAQGHEDVIRLLLNNGAGPNAAYPDRGTALNIAASTGHFGIVKLLLDKEAETSFADADGCTPLYSAVKNGHHEMVKLLLDKGADSTIASNDGQKLLHIAALNGYRQVVQLLLDHGADISATNAEGKTALHLATGDGHEDVVRLLLERGADVSLLDAALTGPLMTAILSGNKHIVQSVLDYGADISTDGTYLVASLVAQFRQKHKECVKGLLDALLPDGDISVVQKDAWVLLKSTLEENKDINESTTIAVQFLENEDEDASVDIYRLAPLQFASSSGHKDIVQLLLDRGADINITNYYGETTLMFAATNGHKDVLQVLIDRGAELEGTSNDGRTSLFEAAQNGHKDAVRFLLDKGADIDSHDLDGHTSLFAAVDGGHEAVVRLLLERGASTNNVVPDGKTPLLQAAINGYNDIMELLLEKGADIEDSTSGWTALNLAAGNGHEDTVRLLLERGVDISAVNINGYTPLISAANNGHTEAVQILLDSEADIGSVDNEEWTALARAAYHGHTATVQLLLDRGADHSVVTNEGFTSLHLAAETGRTEVVQRLIDGGSDLSAATTADGLTPLWLAAQNCHVAIVTILLEAGADMAIACNQGQTALHIAASNGHSDIVELLLIRGADFSGVDGNRWTPLNMACCNGHVRVATLLLEKGADMTVANDIGSTPLNSAISNGHIELMRILLQKGADPKAANDGGWDALKLACKHGQVQQATLLLDSGAEISTSAKDGSTPLIVASDYGHVETVRLLLQRGADLSAAMEGGYTSLSLASCYGHIEIVRVLLDKGAVVMAASDEGWTPLHLACDRGHIEVTQLLLEHGADTGVKNKNGRTPLFTAAENGFAEIVKYLLEGGADVTVLDCDGHSAAFMAAEKSHWTVLDVFLIENTISRLTRNSLVEIFFSTAYGGSLAHFQILMDTHRIEHSATDHQQRNASHFAAWGGRLEILDFLLLAGSNGFGVDVKGNGLLHYATMGASVEVVKKTLPFFKSDSAFSNSWSPLHWACRTGKPEVITLLLQAGHRATRVTTSAPKGQWSPYAIALFHGCEKAISEAIINLPELTIEMLGFTDSQSMISSTKHGAFYCNGCKQDIYGMRFHCLVCIDFDYCFMCYLAVRLIHANHKFEEIEFVTPI